MNKKIQLTALENASLLRKFTILFILMSILPVGILYYFYIEIRDQGTLRISESNFSLTLALVIIGICIGYWVMRIALKRIIQITEENTKALRDVLGFEKTQEMTSNENEIAILARSFNEITTRLEDNVRQLELAKKTLYSVMTKVGRGLSSMENIDSFLDLIVETVAEALQARIGVLLLCDEAREELYVKAVYGVDLPAPRRSGFGWMRGPWVLWFEKKNLSCFPGPSMMDFPLKKKAKFLIPR